MAAFLASLRYWPCCAIRVPVSRRPARGKKLPGRVAIMLSIIIEILAALSNFDVPRATLWETPGCRIYADASGAVAMASRLNGRRGLRWGRGADRSVEFNRDIRPIFSDKCYTCHGPDESKRKSKLRLDTEAGAKSDLGGHFAIVPGDVAKSELIQRVTSHDLARRMPPHIPALPD